MSHLTPISTYNLALKPFNPVPAIDDEYPITIRLTLAAVDPEATDDKEEPSTLRLLKRTNPFVDDDDFSEDDIDSEDDQLDSQESAEESDEETDIKETKKSKKSKASEKEEESSGSSEEETDSSAEDDEDDEEGVSEFVVCTLSPKVQFQQTIDLTISPDEEVYFVVTGSYPIHLTGNYIEHPADDFSDEEEFDDDYSEEEYDLTPDEDEVMDEQEYDLDDLEDASDIENKIEELVEEDKKNEKKRPSDEESSKKSKKAKKDEKKSVQFSEKLEQGPTGSTLTDKKDKKEKAKAKKVEAKAKKEESKPEAAADATKKFPTKTLLGGVVTEDRKVGKGQTAKSGNKVGIRYIGKLKNGKVFDKNTSGKPFVFNLGKGECIKGFDLGVAGMSIGGERRVVIPAKMGYGSQALPGIPSNSELTFDIKLVSLK